VIIYIYFKSKKMSLPRIQLTRSMAGINQTEYKWYHWSDHISNKITYNNITFRDTTVRKKNNNDYQYKNDKMIKFVFQ
jgi:hypothetical protein